MSTSTEKPLVIVTGSSGYIGSAVIEALASDYQLVGFDREAAPHPPADAECVCIDLTDEESLATAFERVKTAHGKVIASVVHLAAYFDLSGEPNPAYERVTLGGTRRLLECLQPFEVEQFIFVSTMLVHAPTEPGEPITESSPIDPKLPYRESKALTEQIVKEQAGEIPIVILRPAGVYDEEGHSAFLAQQIAGIYEQRLIAHFYPGELSVGQPYLHLADLTDAIRRSIENRADLSSETVMLLAEAEVLGYGELQRKIGQLLHDEEWITVSIPPTLAYAGTWAQEAILDEYLFQKPWMVSIANDHYEVDTSRAEELINWSPQHRLSAVLPDITQKLKDDPYSWYRINGLNAARVAHDKVKNADEDEDDSAPEPVQARKEERVHSKSMTKMHFSMLWVHFATMMLGLWLASSPFVLGTFTATEFSDLVQRVTVDRGLWEPEFRNLLTAWNNVIVGGLMMVFAGLSLSRRGGLAQWANACLGVWLLFAPIVFWTPSAAVYLNDTIVGALAIAFTILIPMMPGMSAESMMDPSEVPPGWTYSPSTYLQRIPMIALGLIGFVLARILAAYQLGHVGWVWEPFFAGDAERNGSELIITSEVSKAWPIADGGLGAVTYMFEVLMGIMGGRARWRTMPWMVVLFGIAVVPLGVISIYFIIIQPIVVGTYCTLCLITALGMLVMIPFALDELVAMGQFLLLNTRRGRPFWRAFFKGDALPGGTKDERPGFSDSVRQAYLSAVRGVNVPWTLFLSAVLGTWLMFSRLVFETSGSMADSDHLVGALVITVAVIAMAEVARAVRFINVLFGAWLVIAPWLLTGSQLDGSVSTSVVGLLLIGLSLPRGRRSAEHYGQWDRLIV
tara:strand:- start:17132 stop:19684 length:2553 start_codon:yes stop_codon:yes gene_type:complete